MRWRFRSIWGCRSRLFAFFVVALLSWPSENKLLTIHQSPLLERSFRGVGVPFCVPTLLSVLVPFGLSFPLFLLPLSSVLRRLRLYLFFPLSFPLFKL